MKINMPKEVVKIIEQLNKNEHEAYAVGGCVRDSVSGRYPNDWDITTSALPEQVKQIFPKTIDTGLKHGTVSVLVKGNPYEITTYRIDGEYEDNRRPKTVAFTRDLIKDLERRDFTINAMAYNDHDGLIDPFNGLADIDDQVIKCVGNPNDRFNEDALRMLRAIRFSAQLGFKIDIATRKSIKYNAHLIKNVSAERIKVELDKILISKNPDYIKLLVKFKLIDRIIPEFNGIVGLSQKNPYHVYTVDEHTYKALKNIPNSNVLRWTMYLHDIGKGKTRTIDENGIGHFHGHQEESIKMSKEILERLKFDNDSKKTILKLIEFHDYRFESNMKNVRKAINKIGESLFLSYINVRKADIYAQNPAYKGDRIKNIEATEEMFNIIIMEHQCTNIKDLKVTGKDLIDIGIEQGQKIGEILTSLLELVIEEPEYNEYVKLIEKAKQLNK